MHPARPRQVIGHINHVSHDQRCTPTTKGPDIPWLESTLGPGRSESLLLDAHGRAIESTYSSLIAFEGTTAWHSNHPRALPSTTLPGALQVLRDAGFKVRDAPGFDLGWLWGKRH